MLPNYLITENNSIESSKHFDYVLSLLSSVHSIKTLLVFRSRDTISKQMFDEKPGQNSIINKSFHCFKSKLQNIK